MVARLCPLRYNQLVPTIAIEGSYHLVIYFNDHAPPHCHVLWSGRDAAVRLSDMGHLTGSHLPAKGRKAVAKHIDALRMAWRKYNGG